MTTQEATDELRYAIDLIKQDGKDWLDERDIPVLEMAISALQEQEAKAQLSREGTTSDLISRQAAVDAMAELQGRASTKAELKGISKAWKRIKQLPSAQPESEERKAESAQNVPKEDLISRKVAIDAVAKQMPRSYTPDGSHPADEAIFMAQEIYADCIETIEILPSAQPEIIRCKDCRWRKDQSGSAAWLPCRAIVTPSDFYCCRAERRGDE